MTQGPLIDRVLGRRFASLAVLLALLCPGIAPSAEAQEPAPVQYRIDFENRAHHEARVEVIFTDLSPERSLEVRMSRASPGRYAIHEFAKNVYRVSVTDGAGRALQPTRPDPYGWTVSGHDGTVRFAYTLFGDRVDGTYTGIDRGHAHLNMPATFAWARGLERRSVEVEFRTPRGEEWNVATQLFATDEPFRFTAPNLAYFLDSPTELSAFALREWQAGEPGVDEATVRLAVHHAGETEAVDAFAEMAREIVAEQRAVFGALPRFDGGSYTVIADYLPWASGDGMEHRNSTILTSSLDLEGNALRLLGTLSHEFFHVWNVERIRPADLEPFDFEQANMSDGLWFAEGFTSYYDDLILRRAGYLDDEEYAAGIGRVIDAVVNAPGRRFRSPVEMSRMAPFVDDATSIDPTSFSNTFLSYYTWGAAVGLGLDLELRSRFTGVTLDDFMRVLWERYGTSDRPFAPGSGWTVGELEEVLADLTGDGLFARDFFGRFVRGREVPDFEALLLRAGFMLRPENRGAASLGRAELGGSGAGIVVASEPAVGDPLYRGGVSGGDRIVALDGQPVATVQGLTQALEQAAPGDRWRLTLETRGHTVETTVTLQEDPSLEAVTFESLGRTPTRDHLRFREAWLGSRR